MAIFKGPLKRALQQEVPNFVDREFNDVFGLMKEDLVDKDSGGHVTIYDYDQFTVNQTIVQRYLGMCNELNKEKEARKEREEQDKLKLLQQVEKLQQITDTNSNSNSNSNSNPASSGTAESTPQQPVSTPSDTTPNGTAPVATTPSTATTAATSSNSSPPAKSAINPADYKFEEIWENQRKNPVMGSQFSNKFLLPGERPGWSDDSVSLKSLSVFHSIYSFERGRWIEIDVRR